MTDGLSRDQRTENMRRIKSKNMKPEMMVRTIVHQMGYRYRLHRRDLPGTPDLVFPSRQKIIFVHGCFWHGHKDLGCIDGQRRPKSNLDYWLPKLARNEERDRTQRAGLERLGWSVMIVWECEIRDQTRLIDQIERFLSRDN
jgi:DNA mismatch endonuclease (patch repair protein)